MLGKPERNREQVRNLCKFRRLQLEDAQVDPSPGALHHVASQKEHDAQQHERHDIDRERDILEPVDLHEHDAGRKEAAAEKVDDLLEPEGIVHGDIFAGRRGIHQTDADGHQRKRDAQEQPVELERLV